MMASIVLFLTLQTRMKAKGFGFPILRNGVYGLRLDRPFSCRMRVGLEKTHHWSNGYLEIRIPFSGIELDRISDN